MAATIAALLLFSRSGRLLHEQDGHTRQGELANGRGVAGRCRVYRDAMRRDVTLVNDLRQSLSSVLAVTLDDLIRPLTPAAFIERHLLADTHYTSLPNPLLTDTFLSIPEFQDLRRLVRLYPRVTLFGPDGFRSSVSGHVAMDFHRRGDTLYLTDVEQKLPGLRALFEPVAAALGIDERSLSVEAFAGRQKAISSLHYDHDTNFQILLRGEKLWRLHPNRHIRNPRHPHHDLTAPRDEAFAEQLPLPIGLADLDHVIEVRTTPGMCLYFPMGYWHEVETSEESFAVNLVLKPPRWIDLIGTAVKRTLIAQPALRAPAFGALSRDDSILRQYASRAYAEGLRAYRNAIDDVAVEDGAWAVDANPVRWSAKSRPRRLEETSSSMRLVCPEISAHAFDVPIDLRPIMRRLVAFRGSFTLGDLKAMAPSVSLRALNAVLAYLKVLSYLEDADRHATTAPY